MLSDSLIIRSVVDTDFVHWLPLWEAYNRFYGRNHMPEIITQTTWLRFCDDTEPVYAIVAESNGRLVGLAHYLFHRTTTRIDLNCYLQDLFVNENARGQGIAHHLITDVYKRAQAAGSHRVYWQTHANNLNARKLYDKVAENNGFIVYSKHLDS
jgi:GNAT superfamily N-acetyltransferase